MTIIRTTGYIGDKSTNNEFLQKLAKDSIGIMVTKDFTNVGKIIDTEIIDNVVYFMMEIDNSISIDVEEKHSIGFTMGEKNE